MLILASTLLVFAAQTSPAPASPPASPSPEPRGPVIDRLSWSKDVDGPEPITAIEIRNDFGDIRARGTGDRVLDASMVVQRLDAKGDKVGFTVERHGGVVALVVAYPAGRVRDSDPRPAKATYDRLDLVVFVPKGVTLRAHTLRGRVEVRGLESDVEASTLDEPLFVRTEGAVQARTGGGALTVLLERAMLEAAGPPMVLQSDTGPIELWLPSRGTPDLRVETGGALDTPRLVLRRSRSGGRARGALGTAAAARAVMVSSRSGHVTVRREDPAQFKPAPGAEKE